jgi:hypothetical protein
VPATAIDDRNDLTQLTSNSLEYHVIAPRSYTTDFRLFLQDNGLRWNWFKEQPNPGFTIFSFHYENFRLIKDSLSLFERTHGIKLNILHAPFLPQ